MIITNIFSARVDEVLTNGYFSNLHLTLFIYSKPVEPSIEQKLLAVFVLNDPTELNRLLAVPAQKV